jgi:hypothetical protein
MADVVVMDKTHNAVSTSRDNEKTPWWSHPVLKILYVGVFLLGCYSTLQVWIDARVRAVVGSDDYVRRIAFQVRPSVIFDSNGAILIDQGAMEDIENIEVVPRADGQGVLKNFPLKIIVHPKKYLAHAPLLSCIGPVLVVIEPVRGKKFDWEYPLGNEVSSWVELPSYKFRLELLR